MRVRSFLAWVTVGLCLTFAVPAIAGAGDVAPPPTTAAARRPRLIAPMRGWTFPGQ
jgi:hypothetical protein